MENKQVEKKVENNEYELLKCFSQFMNVKEISKYRKVSKTAIYKGRDKLINKGFLRSVGKNFELTDEGFSRLNSFIQSSNLIRLHNLAIKIKIINKPNNWDLMRSKIVELRNLSKEVKLNNNSYQIHSFQSIKVKTTNNSIIFYLPSIYGKDTDTCLREGLEMTFKAIPKIESMFKVLLIKDRKANIEIISNHYAKLQDSLAKIYHSEKNKLYVKDESGKVWLICDFSFKVDELETIDTINAKEDMDTVKDFLNDLRKNPATVSQVLEMIKMVTANQVIFDKNFQSHLKAINTLTNEVKGLGNAIRDIKEENKKLRLGNQTTLNNFK